MSLTTHDLQQIREICLDENQAIENDVKDIYHIILAMQKNMRAMQKQMDKGFKSLSDQIASTAEQACAPAA
jgi:hypothetical protein